MDTNILSMLIDQSGLLIIAYLMLTGVQHRLDLMIQDLERFLSKVEIILAQQDNDKHNDNK